MADLVNVGIAGRVYVRFGDDVGDTAALTMFKRAGARLDRERGLWFVGEHQRDAAEAAVIGTFGDMTGEAVTVRREADNGGLVLVSGWVLVSAGPSGIEYRNPYSTNPAAIQVVSWDDADEAILSGPEGLRDAIHELVQAAEVLVKKKPDREPFSGVVVIHGDTFPVRDRLGKLGGYFDKEERVWYVPADKAAAAKLIVEQGPKEPQPEYRNPKPMTERQRDTLDGMLCKLAKLDDDAAERIRAKINWDAITVSEASDLIQETGDEIREWE